MKVNPEFLKGKRISWLSEQSIDVKMSVLRHYAEISLLLVNDILDDEVHSLSGDRYSHNKPNDGRYSRWGYNPGSIRIGNEKARVQVPRVYDHEVGGNVSLESYRNMNESSEVSKELLTGIIKGLSMSDYREVVQKITDSFGLSRSSVSNRFIEESSEKLKEFEERKLDQYEFVALFIDGKYLSKEQIVIVLGITSRGEKIPLCFIQTHTENAKSIKEMLIKLVDRGLSNVGGLLCVVDGSKGILKALREVFGDYAVIQRCQWHKKDNVLSYLNGSDKDYFKRKLNKAYNSDSYEEAKEKLLLIRDELKLKNLSAARSLEEGLEETLTLQRLGLKDLFGRSFSTTNDQSLACRALPGAPSQRARCGSDRRWSAK